MTFRFRIGVQLAAAALVLGTAQAAAGMSVGARQTATACEQSPVEDRLPTIVGPMTGRDPAWLVDGGSAKWAGPDEPVKTLWVFDRTSATTVRVEGRRLDGVGRTRFRTGMDEPITDTLVVENLAVSFAIPGGATPEIMRTYAFIPSHVFYPSAGCWEFAVHFDDKDARIVLQLK